METRRYKGFDILSKRKIVSLLAFKCFKTSTSIGQGIPLERKKNPTAFARGQIPIKGREESNRRQCLRS